MAAFYDYTAQAQAAQLQQQQQFAGAAGMQYTPAQAAALWAQQAQGAEAAGLAASQAAVNQALAVHLQGNKGMGNAFQQQVAAQQAALFQQQRQQQPQQQMRQAYVPKHPSAQPGDAGIVGSAATVRSILLPVQHLDPELELEEMVWKVCGYIGKAARKYWDDEERMNQRCTSLQAEIVVEEFVQAAMGNISAGCHQKPWYVEADFSPPLFHAVMESFANTSKFFCRTLKSTVQKQVEQAVFHYKEDERIQKVMWDAVSISGLPESYHKKASKHLQSSYDDAHMNAPWGSTTAGDDNLFLVQDFVKGWMSGFINKAYDVLNNGVSEEMDEQFALVTTLFQHLCDPQQLCLPHDLVSAAAPPEAWTFVADTALALLQETNGKTPVKGKGATKGGSVFGKAAGKGSAASPAPGPYSGLAFGKGKGGVAQSYRSRVLELEEGADGGEDAFGGEEVAFGGQ